jgi:hypothetical protein
VWSGARTLPCVRAMRVALWRGAGLRPPCASGQRPAAQRPRPCASPRAAPAPCAARRARLRPCAPRAADGATPAAPSAAAATTQLPINIKFDNAASPSGTSVSLVGHDTAGLLASVLAAFATLGVQVVTASISTTTAGDVSDTFVVTGADGQKLPEADLEQVRAPGGWGGVARPLGDRARAGSLLAARALLPSHAATTTARNRRSASECSARCAWAPATAGSPSFTA